MASDNGLTLDWKPIGKNGQACVTLRFPDGTSFTDKIDTAKESDRESFVRSATKGRKGIDRKLLAAELQKIAAEIVAKAPADGEQEEEKKRKSQADLLVELAQKAELFHTPGGHDSEGYATVQVNGHAETSSIKSNSFRRWLGKEFFDRHEKAPNSQAIQDAVNVIAGKAIFEGKEHPVAVRLAATADAIYLDLADADWRAVRIDSAGWSIAANPPVKFIRKRGMLPLPVPVKGGSIGLLRDLVNVPDDDVWKLFVAWLVAALRPGRPFPILAVNGEQGSAKSTLCKMGRALIDPNSAALRRPPRDDRDLMIAATNGWIVAYDNLSGVPASLSDALCTLATGGGFATRELYTDGDEKLFEATRPILLNGIEDLATRSDLLDRSLTLTLPTIPDHLRRDEEDLWRRFDELRPLMLGALLDAVSAALRNRPHVKLAEKPRMADFACWIVAAESALGWPPSAFLNAYNRNRGAGNALAIESSIIGPPIVSLAEKTGSWTGTALDLLTVLETQHAGDKAKKHRDWPTTPRKLSGELRRLAPNLRRKKIEVTFGEHGKRGTSIAIERTGIRPSPPSPSCPNGVPGDGGDGSDDDLQAYSPSLDPNEEVIEWTA